MGTNKTVLINSDVKIIVRDVDGDQLEVSGDNEAVFITLLNDDGTEFAFRSLNEENVETIIDALTGFKSNLSAD